MLVYILLSRIWGLFKSLLQQHTEVICTKSQSKLYEIWWQLFSYWGIFFLALSALKVIIPEHQLILLHPDQSLSFIGWSISSLQILVVILTLFVQNTQKSFFALNLMTIGIFFLALSTYEVIVTEYQFTFICCIYDISSIEELSVKRASIRWMPFFGNLQFLNFLWLEIVLNFTAKITF